MRIRCVSDCGSSRALIIFAGWGMDSHPFEGLFKSGYDIFVVWDYRSLALDFSSLERYDELCVIAWSWGVLPAARFIETHSGLPVTLAVAVNGTLYPVDDARGIPHAIFQGTFATLDERRLMKFYRRMMPDAMAMERFRAALPQRQVDELKDELKALASMPVPDEDEACRLSDLFDSVMLASSDAVIPYASQCEAWRRHHAQQHIEGAHYPDFASLIDRVLVDKDLVRERFCSSASTYQSEAAPQRNIACRLMELWLGLNPSEGGDFVEVGVGTGFLTDLYTSRLHPASLILWDLYASRPDVEECDAETAIRSLPDGSVDAVVGASAIQWFNSISSFLSEVSRVLRPGGWGVFSTFAPDNFAALTRLTGRSPSISSSVPLPVIKDLDLLVNEVGSMPVKFATPALMLRHLKLSGVNAIVVGSKAAVMARNIIRDYPRDPDGGVTLVYRPQYIIFKKPVCH